MRFEQSVPEALVAGVDEAGRGPLCGPVVAAAVILDPRQPIEGLRDSKKLSAARRAALYEEICAKSLAWSTGRAEAAEIDQINILQATFLAMQRAISTLSVVPEKVYVDGNVCPKIELPCIAVVGGDDSMPAIAAASIVAKVTRDRAMVALDQTYPHYGIAQHKGYPTPAHLEALARYGPAVIHRRSFAPVKKFLQ